MICRNCNAEIQDGVQSCPYCGYNYVQEQNYGMNNQPNMQNNMFNNGFNQNQQSFNGGFEQNTQGFNQGSMFDQTNQQQNFNQFNNNYQQPPKKKGKGCLIAIIIFLIIGALGLGGLVIGGTLLFGAAKSSFDISEDGLKFRVGTEGFDAGFDELNEDLDVLMEELDDMSKGEYSGEDIDENYVEENNDNLQKDSDGDGVLDTDIFDNEESELNEIVDIDYIGEFLGESFRAGAIVQEADGVHWQLIARLNDISSTENLELILTEDKKSLDKLYQLREEYGLMNCYENEHLETIQEVVLKDINNEIFLLEKYLKVSEEIRNGDQSGVNQFYKDEATFKERDLTYAALYELLINAGKVYGLSEEDCSNYMMPKVEDVELRKFN